MFLLDKISDWSARKLRTSQGFSLIEMMIVVALVGIIVVVVISSYTSQSESFTTQQNIARIQQDLRGAIYLMQYDVMNAGRDPNQMMAYGMADIRHYDFNAGSLGNTMLPPPAGGFPANRPINFPTQQLFNSFPVIEFSSLRIDDSVPPDGIGDVPMNIRYQVFDFNGDNRLDLGRRIGINGAALSNPPDLVAEGVIAIGYVFAFDNSPDGAYKLTRDPVLNTVIWGADTTGDGNLDTNIDRNGDGRITIADDLNQDGTINALDPGAGAAFPATELRFIRSVKISILLQSARPSEEDWIDRNQYVVGNLVIPPGNQPRFNDKYRRRVKTITVALRNFQKI